MSVVEEPSQENDQKEPEVHLQEDELNNEFDPEDQKDTNMRMKDLKTGQKDKRTVNALSLFKEDFSQFKEEVFRVFRDKDMKTEHGDNKPASSTLDLLKEDFSQIKEDVSSVFSINSSKDKESTDPKTSRSAEKTINRLSFLKDDLSNVFRIGLSREKDNKGITAKEDSSDTFKIKVSKAERTDEPFKSLFRRDQKAENSQRGKKTFSEQSEEQTGDGFKGNLSEQNDETADAEKINNMKDRTNEQMEDSELDSLVSEEKTESLSETRQSEEMIRAAQAGRLTVKLNIHEETHELISETG